MGCLLEQVVVARDFGTDGVEILWVQTEIVDGNRDGLLTWLAHEDREGQYIEAKERGELRTVAKAWTEPNQMPMSSWTRRRGVRELPRGRDSMVHWIQSFCWREKKKKLVRA